MPITRTLQKEFSPLRTNSVSKTFTLSHDYTLKCAIAIITEAYIKRQVTEGDTHHMAYGMAYHKEETETEEEKFPHTLLREEEKEKEESFTTTTTTKKSKKKFFFLLLMRLNLKSHTNGARTEKVK